MREMPPKPAATMITISIVVSTGTTGTTGTTECVDVVYRDLDYCNIIVVVSHNYGQQCMQWW